MGLIPKEKDPQILKAIIDVICEIGLQVEDINKAPYAKKVIGVLKKNS